MHLAIRLGSISAALLALLATPHAGAQDTEPQVITNRNGVVIAKSFINQAAPPFVVEEWYTEEPNRKGKFVLLDFWATWCGPCRKSIPKLNALHEDYPDRLTVIGITDETESKLDNSPLPRIDYAVALAPQRRMYRQFGIRAIPYAILIDPEGIVRWEGNPLVPAAQKAITNLLKDFKPQPEKSEKPES